jgi:hypothetical protein
MQNHCKKLKVLHIDFAEWLDAKHTHWTRIQMIVKIKMECR